VWRQDDVTHPTSYWLAAAGKPKAGDEIIADRKGQIFSIAPESAPASVMLNDELVNLDESVTVMVAGREVFKGTVKRTIGTMMKTLDARGDRRLIFSASVP
jgi:hypothetical protein